MNNCLITSCGRRNTLLGHFKKAAREYGGKVIGADMSSFAPALYDADIQLEVPAVKSERYIPFLLEAVKEHEIAMIIPTIDTELMALAENESKFAELGCSVFISSPGFCRICADKLLTAHEFTSRGIRTPKSWDGLDLPADSELPEHLYIKPRDGSASVNVFKITKCELSDYVNRVPNPIVQQELLGEEITIDAFISPDGKVLHYVPRRRIRTLAGESIVGVTCDDGHLDQWCEATLAVCAGMGARWAITLQAFETEQGLVLTEINPRFGGGVPLAFAAGGEYARWAYMLKNGQELKPRLGDYKRRLFFMRYMTEEFTENPCW